MATGEIVASRPGSPDEHEGHSAAHGVREGHPASHGEGHASGGAAGGRDEPGELPQGATRTPSGRVSSAEDYSEPQPLTSPFSEVQLSRLDEALTLVSRHTQLRFSLFLGELGDDSHTGASRLHDQLGAAGADSVLVAVDPGNRRIDIITGAEARVRLSDRGCKLAVMSMAASFKEGDLLGGLLSGLRMLSDQAGIPHHGH